MNEAEIYEHGLARYGESPEALHWYDYRSMGIRFKNLIRDIEVEGRSVLDAGCGMGDLIPYLYTRASRFDYLGVDINPGFIAIAKKRYKGHRFEVGDPFSGKFGQHADLVFSSGVMNIKLKDWQKRRLKMIEVLFDLSKETLVFNMAGGYGPQRRDNLIAYADARKVADFCTHLTPNLEVRAGYLPDDFTIVMHK